MPPKSWNSNNLVNSSYNLFLSTHCSPIVRMASGFPSLAHSSSPFPLPSIPEDTLDYTLHLPHASTQNPSALALLISEYVESLLIQPWLWNKDSWELKVVSQSGEHAAEGGRLGGRMRVGDAVDDEWLVVYLLRQVSKRWPELVIGWVPLYLLSEVLINLTSGKYQGHRRRVLVDRSCKRPSVLGHT